MKRVALCLMLLLTACAPSGCSDVPKPETPAQIVYAAKAAYAVALVGAVEYRSLPRCQSGGLNGPNMSQPLCHDPVVLGRVQLADQVADAALDGAERTVRDPAVKGDRLVAAAAVARHAVDIFVQIVGALPRKGERP